MLLFVIYIYKEKMDRPQLLRSRPILSLQMLFLLVVSYVTTASGGGTAEALAIGKEFNYDKTTTRKWPEPTKSCNITNCDGGKHYY